MSHVVRYTLACLILAAGIMGAWKFRVPADETGDLQESPSISEMASELLEKINNEPKQPVALVKQEPREIFNPKDDQGPVDPFLDLGSTVIPISGEYPGDAHESSEGGDAPRWVAREPTDAPKIDEAVPIWQASHGAFGASPNSVVPSPAGHGSQSPNPPTADQPHRGFIPARRSSYLPRAFYRHADGPSAELPRVNRALR